MLTPPTFRSVEGAYLALLKLATDEHKHHIAARGNEAREVVGVGFRLPDPRQRLPCLATRTTNPAFQFAEALWYLADRRDLEISATTRPPCAPAHPMASASAARPMATPSSTRPSAIRSRRSTGSWSCCARRPTASAATSRSSPPGSWPSMTAGERPTSDKTSPSLADRQAARPPPTEQSGRLRVIQRDRQHRGGKPCSANCGSRAGSRYCSRGRCLNESLIRRRGRRFPVFSRATATPASQRASRSAYRRRKRSLTECLFRWFPLWFQRTRDRTNKNQTETC